jgi:hypothetical protein
MTLHANECACELKTRAQPDSFAVTGVLCALALVASMPHAIRRSLRAVACANDSAGEQMRTRTQNAHERAFARSSRALVSRANKMCAMVLSYSCHAPLRAYELSTRAAGATACMRVRVWPHRCAGACVTVSTCTCALPFARVAVCLRVRCVCATGLSLPT